MPNHQAENIAHGMPHDWVYRTGSGGYNDQQGDWTVNERQTPGAETRRRDNAYVPFESVFQPDGRHAYSPQENFQRFPQQTTAGNGTRRDMAILPTAGTFPRDATVDMCP